jgi:GT2 family glycosyltransferase
MDIGFVFTNFNNSLLTKDATQSIFENSNSHNAVIVIVDNKSNRENVAILKENFCNTHNVHLLFNESNVGYFNGLNCGIKYLRSIKEHLKLIVIGNNDLIFANTFIDTIFKNIDNFQHYAVISPNIVTLDGVHQNPHVIDKIGKFRELMYDLYYSNYYLSLVIKNIAEALKTFSDRKDEESHEIPQNIYQGYGACYILGPLFFEYFNALWAPTFLYGEEFFLSLQLKSEKLRVYYDPEILVKHRLHSTMAKIQGKQAWNFSREAHRIYRKYLKIYR